MPRAVLGLGVIVINKTDKILFSRETNNKQINRHIRQDSASDGDWCYGIKGKGIMGGGFYFRLSGPRRKVFMVKCPLA